MNLNIQLIAPNQWLLDVRTKKNRREIRKRETFYGTKAKAQERYVQLKAKLRNGVGSIGFQNVEYFSDILDIYKEKSSTFSSQRRSMFSRIYSDLGHISLPGLADGLEFYLKQLRSVPTSKTGKPFANASLNRVLQMVNASLNMAVKMEIIERNPITPARFPKFKEVARDRVLTEEETKRLLTIIRTEASHLEAIVQYALRVPCRKSELVNMKKEDLSLDGKYPGIRIKNGTTKNDEGLWKPIPPEMLSYFQSIPEDCPYLFFRIVNGKYFPLGDFKKAWSRCRKLAGIKDFHFHDSRHISASAMSDEGTSEPVINQVAGWKTNMLRTYYHRAGKQALALVKFKPTGGLQVDTPTENDRKTLRFLSELTSS